jgi:hypothetical protein
LAFLSKFFKLALLRAGFDLGDLLLEELQYVKVVGVLELYLIVLLLVLNPGLALKLIAPGLVVAYETEVSCAPVVLLALLSLLPLLSPSVVVLLGLPPSSLLLLRLSPSALLLLRLSPSALLLLLPPSALLLLLSPSSLLLAPCALLLSPFTTPLLLDDHISPHKICCF